MWYNKNMKKNIISSNYITAYGFCQFLQRYSRFGAFAFAGILLLVSILMPATVMAAEYTEKKGVAIIDNCSSIKEDLKNVQKSDAKARLYLGGRYETLLTKYVKALNIKLVENNNSNLALLENQNQLVQAKLQFMDDFITYQKDLEELIAMDCKTAPENFYQKLEVVRSGRAKMRSDVANMNAFLGQHARIVEGAIGGDNAKTE